MPGKNTTVSTAHRWMPAAAGWYVAYARPLGSDPTTCYVRCDVYPVAAWEITHGQHGPTSGKPVVAKDGVLVTLEPPAPGEVTHYMEVTRIPGGGRAYSDKVDELIRRGQNMLERNRRYVFGGDR